MRRTSVETLKFMIRLLTYCFGLVGMCSICLLTSCDSELPNTTPETPPISEDLVELEPYVWKLPEGIPLPVVPEDNPMSEAKVSLGRYLFYEPMLSVTQDFSCGACHRQELAFTDGLPLGIGATDEVHILGSMSLVNVAYATTLGWANPVLERLETQALIPMFGEEPVELGLSGISESELLARFKDHSDYPMRFSDAFPGEMDPISVPNIAKAIASFIRTLISFESPYDQYTRGDEEALSNSAKRGMRLFFSEDAECFHCHGGFNFTDAAKTEGTAFTEKPFHNNGLYNVDGEGSYPTHQGVYEQTSRSGDLGRFKAPTLRNIELTAPYMHDGSIQTLEEVIEHYAAGGQLIEEGPNAGDGRLHPNKSEFVPGLLFSELDKIDLVNFLKSLTDPSVATKTEWSDPF